MMNGPSKVMILPNIPFKIPSNDILSFSGEEHHYHILSYGWLDGKPGLELLPLHLENGFLHGNGEVFSLSLTDLDEVNLRISGDPVCTGRYSDEGYTPCPDSNPPFRGFSQCFDCITKDIPDPNCIFEPHCHQGPCGAKFCQVEHVVYITAFRKSFKVGMTQFRRMKKRAMEQGADGMLPLLTLKDRFSARAFEGVISKSLGLPQMVRSHTKISNMVKRRDLEETGEDLLQLKSDVMILWDDIVKKVHPEAVAIKEPAEFDHSPILIDDYPLEEPLPSKPKMFKGERITGKVLGFKGSYMLFRQGNIWAYRLAEVPGRVLHSEKDLLN